MQKMSHQSSLNDKIQETQLMNCFICTQWYTLDTKRPIAICQNRHALCMECTKSKLFKKQYDVNNNFTGRYQCPKCYQVLIQDKFKQDPLLMQICTLIYAIKQKEQSSTKKARQTYGLLVQEKMQMKISYQSKINQIQIQKNQLLQKKNQLQRAIKYQKEQNQQAQAQIQKLTQQLQNQKKKLRVIQKQKAQEIDNLKQILKMKSQEAKLLRILADDQLNQLATYKTLYSQKQQENKKLKKQVAQLKKIKQQQNVSPKKTPKQQTQKPIETKKQTIVIAPIKKQNNLAVQKISHFLLIGKVQKAQGFSIKGQKITKKTKKGFFGKVFAKGDEDQNYISVFSDSKIVKNDISCFKIKVINSSVGAICYGIAPDSLKGKTNIFNQQMYIGYRGINGKIWIGGKWKQGAAVLKKTDDTIKIVVDMQNLLVSFIINDKIEQSVSTVIPQAMKNIQFYPVVSMKCQDDSVQFLKSEEQN